MVFGAHPEIEAHAAHAGACAIEMQASLGDVNLELIERGLPALQCGLALHTGPAVIGSLGSRELWKPSLVGGALTTLERLASMSTAGRVLASQEHLDALGELARVEGKIHLQLAGSAVVLYELAGVGDLHL